MAKLRVAFIGAGTQAFMQAVRHGGSPELTAEEGREVLRFSLAAHRSAREGRPGPSG